MSLCVTPLRSCRLQATLSRRIYQPSSGSISTTRFLCRPITASALPRPSAQMFRHVVLLTVKESADVERIVKELNNLPSVIPELLSYSAGRDAGISPGNASIAVVADFKSQEDYAVYRDNSEHQRIIAELIKPHAAGRTAVQYELPADKVQGGTEGTK
jgi:hypothetical protein